MIEVLKQYWILLAILVLFMMLALYVLYTYFASKDFDKRYKEIIKRVKVIYYIPIKNKLDNLEKMAKYSDIYKRGVVIWSRMYNDIVDNELTGVSAWLEHIKNARDDRDYDKASSLIAELLPKIEVLELKVNALNDQLDKAREVEILQKKELERNKERWSKLKIAYNTSRPLLHEFHTYLDGVIKGVDTQFSSCIVAINEGRADEARKTIDRIEDNLIEFGKAIDTIPDISSLCNHVIPDNLDKLTEKVNEGRLKSIGFHHLNFEKAVQDIKSDCARVLELIEKDKINEAIELCNTLHHEELTLEKKVEAEFTAAIAIGEFYPKIKSNFDDLTMVISDVEPEIKKAVETAKLSEEDLQIVAELKDSFKNVRKIANKLEGAIRNKLQHSTVELLKGIEYLDKMIVKTKLTFERQITVLKTADISAKRASNEIKEQNFALIQMENSLLTCKYKLEKADELKQIVDIKIKLDKLTDDLKKPDTILSSINKELTITRELIGLLSDTINKKLKTVALAEQAIVVGNRYLGTDPKFDKALIASQVRFDSGNYDESLSGLLKTFKKFSIDVTDELGGELDE